MWKILCTRSGGKLGFGQGYAKKDGKEMIFDSKEEAQAVAERWEKEMNGPYSSAHFTYEAVEIRKNEGCPQCGGELVREVSIFSTSSSCFWCKNCGIRIMGIKKEETE